MKTMTRLSFFAIMLLTVSLLASSVMANPVIIGHRGFSAIAPENTVTAITMAAPYAWGVEIDIRRTADGEYILMHDASVDRTTNGTGSVSGLTYDYIRSLDAGSWKSPMYTGEQVPNITEAINAAMTNDVKLCVEIKSGSAAELLSILAPYSDAIEVHSFNWGLLQSIDDLGGDFTYVAIGSGSLDAAATNIPTCIDKVSWAYGGISQSGIDTLHAMDKEVYAWTVDSGSAILALAGMGVDGIITNDSAMAHYYIPPDVPEPSTVVLLVAGALCGLFAFRRRSAKR